MRDQGVRQLPRDVFHIADAANWPGILSGGLLCTAEIAARLGRDADVYEKLISFRPKSVEVPKVAYVRDQAPTYSITGIENSPPSLMPDGQRAVTVLVRV